SEALDMLAKRMIDLSKEAAEATMNFNIDREGNRLTGDMTFTAKPGSNLAKEIEDAGKSQSLFGSLVSSKAAINFLFHGVLPEDIRKVINPFFDEGYKKALKEEKDDVKRQVL